MDTPASNTDLLLGEVAFVHRLARALLRDAEQAHDVAQDALLAALQEGPVRHVRGWLAAVTRHLAGRTRREARERAAREARAARPPAHDGEERTAERLRLHRRLTDAVMALPEPYRTAVTLRFFDELPPRAIAQRLQLPAATVRQHVHRGLAMLRHQLDGEFGGRDRWRAAFAAIALGKSAVPFLVWIPVLAMKKVVVSAALVAAAVGGWWMWPRSDAPPVTTHIASSPPSPATATAANSAKGAPEPNIEAERTVATVPTARDEAFVVLVVDEREQPIAGADVHRWTIAGASSKQRTDRDGRIEFAALDGAGGVVVRATGFAPLVRELTPLSGEVRCTLPDGALLDGTMLVDGVPAPAGLRVGVLAPLALPESAPPELRKLLPNYRPSAFAVTGPGGTFAFRGLAADREVMLELPRTHWFVPESDVIEVEQGRDGFGRRSLLPARGVVLRTTQLPTVYGRVVWDDDGSTVCAPDVTVFGRLATGEGCPGLTFTGNDDGTFATGFYPASSSAWLRWAEPGKRHPLASVHLQVQADGSEGSTTVSLDEKALATLPIEVRLPRATVTHFVVTDLDERPIAGARVSAKPSTPTDDSGRGTFQGRRDKVLVGADGHQVQPAVSHRPAAGTASNPLRFRLAPRNHLVLSVRDAAGGVPPIRFVRILSRSGGLFCGKRFHNSFDQTFGGSEANSHSSGRPQPDGSTETYEWSCTTRPDANGRIELHSLEPGVPCTVTATDVLGGTVATATFVMPPAGETRTVHLTVAEAPRSVRGRVAARDGTPIPNALVELRGEQHGSSEAKAGADGAFLFAGIYTRGPLTLEAKVTGYAEAEKSIAAVDEADEHVLVLEPGQRVTLRVVDEAGQPVETSARAEQIPGMSLHPQSVQAGEHLFTDLPSGLVTFEVAFGGAKFRVQHDTANPNVVLRVPRPARLVVGPLPNGASSDKLGVRATRLDAPGDAFRLRIGAGDAEAELVVQGRYRVELYRVTWRGYGETRERVEEPAAPAQEVEAKAGDLVRVKF